MDTLVILSTAHCRRARSHTDRAAKQRVPRDPFNFGGAETETTRQRNRRHLDRLALQQNVRVDVRKIDLSTSLLGVPPSSPVAVAPSA